MSKIIGIGNALVDVTVHLDDEHDLGRLRLEKGSMTLIDSAAWMQLNEHICNERRQMSSGGSAANTILALALIGDEVGLMGCVGQDEMGDFLAEQTRQRGIDAHLIRIPQERTGVATVFITPDGERTFATHLGASAMMDVDLLPTNAFDGYDILHVEGYLVQNHPLTEHVLRAAKAAGLRVSYDLASFNVVRDDHDFVRHVVEEYVDIVFANRDEASAFSRQNDPEVALSELADMTNTAIVKLGNEGAIAMRIGSDGTRHKARVLSHSEVTAADSTGAGDFFAAGFLHGVIHGCDLNCCLELGNCLAEEVIQVTGTRVTAQQLRRATEQVTRK